MYLGYLNLAVWRCYISFLSRWCGSDVLLYGGLHTYSFVYVVDPFACRFAARSCPVVWKWLGRPRGLPVSGIWAPPYYFNHFRTSRLESRSVIHRGSYNWYQSHPALQGLSQMVVVSLANILVVMYTREKQNARVGLLPLFFLPPPPPFSGKEVYRFQSSSQSAN